MARSAPVWNSFTSGAITPKLRARTDSDVYQTGCRTLTNAVVLPEGGVSRRMGFRHVGATKTPAKASRLIPFQFSTTQAYMLEFGDLYVRVYKDGALLRNTVELVTNGSFDTDIAGWTVVTGPDGVSWDAATQALRLQAYESGGFPIAAHVQQAVTVTPGQSHTVRFTAAKAGSGSVRVRIGTTSGGQDLLAETTFGSGGETPVEVTVTPPSSPMYVGYLRPGGFSIGPAFTLVDDVSVQLTTAAAVEVVTPYVEGDLKDLQWAQDADVLVLVHPRHAPRRLIRTSHTAWFLQAIDFFDGPYLPENVNDTWTLVSSAASGSVTLTAAGAGFAPFQAGHVGSTWRLTFGTVTTSARITAVTDSTHATAFAIDRIDDTGAAGFVLVGGSFGAGFGTPTAVWAEGAWSAVRGFPAAITRGEGRFWYGYTDTEPTGLWGTVTDEPYSMDPDTGDDGSGVAIPVDDSALDVNLRDRNALRGMTFSPTGLVAQTIQGELVANGGSADQAIVPPGPKVRPATDHGGRAGLALPPLQIDRVTLLVNRTGTKLLGFEFSFDLEAYVAKDLLRRSRHLASAGLIALAYAGDPDPIVWGCTADGGLVSMTYEPEEGVFGWASHPVGAAGVVESIAVIPNTAGSADELWAVIRRTVAGATRRDVERLDPASGIDLDAHLTYSGAPATTFAGLGHLEGETVWVLADGSFVGEATVSGGSVTLATAASSVQIGLPYTSTLGTLRLAARGALTDPAGVAEVLVRLHETRAVEIQVSAPHAKAQRPPLRLVADPPEAPAALVSDDVKVATLGWDQAAQVTVTNVGPGPWTVLGVGLVVERH